MKSTTTQPEIKSIRMELIRRDGGCQCRGGLNDDYVDQLVADIGDGATLPPITVYFDGKDFWLSDGYHRYAARQERNDVEVVCEVHLGSQRDAQWHGIGANKAHNKSGLRLATADKQRAVQAAIKHPNAEKLSNVQIAEHVGVSKDTVAKYRKELETTCEISKSTERIGRDGRKINVANIGKTPAKPRADEADAAVAWAAAHPEDAVQAAVAAREAVEYEEGIIGDEPDPIDTSAQLLNVSTSAVRLAKTVIEHGIPALQQAVERGDMEVGEAAAIAAKPADEQEKIVSSRQAGPIKDEVGHEIKDPAMQAIFAERAAFRSLAKQISDLKAKFAELAGTTAGAVATSRIKGFNAAIDNARAEIRFSTPYSICPYCGGRKCLKCSQNGWMAEATYAAVPKDERGTL